MTKKLLASLLLFIFLALPATALALDLGGGMVKSAAGTAGYDANADETSFAELIGSIIKTVLSFVGVIFLVLMVYAGYLWMTARGDETQIEKSQNIIRSSIIGLAITVGSFSITAFILPKILEKTTGDSGLPADGGEGSGDQGGGIDGPEERGVVCCVFNQPGGNTIKREGHCLDVQPICVRAAGQGGGLIDNCSDQQLLESECR